MSGLTEKIEARVDHDTYAALVKEAKRSERSIGAVVRIALREHIAKSRRKAL